MLNYFFTIKSHIIDLFIMGRVIQYRFEIDVVPLLVGLVYLGVGDGGGFMVVAMVAYMVHVMASWAWVWPFASGGDLFVVAVGW